MQCFSVLGAQDQQQSFISNSCYVAWLECNTKMRSIWSRSTGADILRGRYLGALRKAPVQPSSGCRIEEMGTLMMKGRNDRFDGEFRVPFFSDYRV